MNATTAPDVRPPEDRNKPERRLKDWKPSDGPVDVFRGRAGTSARRVFEACVVISKSADWLRPSPPDGPAPSSVFHASVRQVASMTGQSDTTVWKCLSLRLGPRRLNFVRLVARAQGSDGNVYELTPQARAWLRAEWARLNGSAHSQHTLESPRKRSVLTTRASSSRVSGRPSDCWAGLGVPKQMVYELLDDRPQTVAELVHAYRKSPSTIRKHLKDLASHGLAEKGADGWVRGHASLDDVAVAIGSAGAGEHRAKRHHEERERWREWTRRERAQRPEVVDAFQRKMLAASDTTSVEVTA